ncbi:MAG: MBL fold metallo-hydrolase [Candidatus Bathyarchaeota archaeon]|nr:MAG: MBL fold metallo-hydrolase [Candidatus Bathyarchaeota archaeon]
MIFEKIKSEVVSHLSYFIGSGNEAFVVDPRRDCQIYVDIAKREGMNIRHIFETHRNEDYVIGSLELASLTGAEIYHGPWPEFKYGEVVPDGQEFRVGKLKVTAIRTPGHTPGDISIAVADTATGGETVIVCTGDTLFVNDTGRTDFGGPEARREWSENLYDSIFNKLFPLGDHVVLCPAHGSGSVCGGKIADREMSTLGLERLMNPVLQLGREEFVRYKAEERHEYAPYFGRMEVLNVEGAPNFGVGPNPPALTAEEFKEKWEGGAIVLDTRPPPSFGAGHIKGSYSLALKRLGLVGWVLPHDRPVLLLMTSQSHFDYLTRNLSRIGYDNVAGYMAGSIVDWYKKGLPVERLDMMTVPELKKALDSGEDWLVLDVRSHDEWEEGHIEGATNIYVGLMEKRLDEVPQDRRVAVICKSGTRSGFASSIMLREGRENIHNVLGGMEAWKALGYPTVQ